MVVGAITTSQAISKMQSAAVNTLQSTRRSTKTPTNAPTKGGSGGTAGVGSSKGDIDEDLKAKVLPVINKISRFLKNPDISTSLLTDEKVSSSFIRNICPD